MIDLDDIQHLPMTRPHALAARYEFMFARDEMHRDRSGGPLTADSERGGDSLMRFWKDIATAA